MRSMRMNISISGFLSYLEAVFSLRRGKKTERAPPRRPRRPHLKFTLATLYSIENQKEVTYLKKYKKSCQMCLIVVKIREY